MVLATLADSPVSGAMIKNLGVESAQAREKAWALGVLGEFIGILPVFFDDFESEAQLNARELRQLKSVFCSIQEFNEVVARRENLQMDLWRLSNLTKSLKEFRTGKISYSELRKQALSSGGPLTFGSLTVTAMSEASVALGMRSFVIGRPSTEKSIDLDDFLRKRATSNGETLEGFSGSEAARMWLSEYRSTADAAHALFCEISGRNVKLLRSAEARLKKKGRLQFKHGGESVIALALRCILGMPQPKARRWAAFINHFSAFGPPPISMIEKNTDGQTAGTAKDRGPQEGGSE